MPLALGHWGICSSAHAPPVQIKRYAHNVDYPHTLTSSLRSLPAKTTALAKTVTVADYAPPLSPLIHQLKFSGAVKSPAPCHVCYYWKSYTPSHHRVAIAGSHHQRSVMAARHWRRGFNQSDLLCQPLSRCCTANGIAKPSHVHGPLRPSISQCPAAQAQPEKCLSS